MAAATPEPKIVEQDEWLAGLGGDRFDLEVRMWGYGRFRTWLQTEPHSVLAPNHDHALIFAHEAACCYGPPGPKLIRIEPGTLFWLSPGVPQDFWIPPEVRTSTPYYFRFHLTQNGRPVRLREDRRILTGAWDLLPLIDAAVQEQIALREYRLPRIRAHLMLLITMALRLEQQAAPAEKGFSALQAAQLERYVARHYARWPSTADLAKYFNLSPDYFSRVFHRSFGKPPRQWLVEQRIKLAARRLRETTLSISQVAYEFGYDSVEFFSRQFKTVMKQSPRAFRKEG